MNGDPDCDYRKTDPEEGIAKENLVSRETFHRCPGCGEGLKDCQCDSEEAEWVSREPRN